MKRKGIIIGIALVIAGAGAFGLLQLQKRAKVAEIISDEAEWDLKDAAVRPLPVRIDVNKFEDGIYPVAFDQKEITKAEGGYMVTFEIFNLDLYDAVELHQMEVGGYIEVDGELMKIDSLSKVGRIVVNGSIEEGGAEFIPIGGGVYRYQGMDDVATYTSFGKVTLFVPDTIDFVDLGNVEESMAGVTIPGEKAFDYLTTIDYGYFNQYSTTIRIEKGAVVGFSRSYRP